MTKQTKQVKEPKLAGDIIINEFLELRDFVGQNLKFLHDAAYNCAGLETPVAFEQVVVDSTNSALTHLNSALKGFAEKFKGLKVKPPRE